MHRNRPASANGNLISQVYLKRALNNFRFGARSGLVVSATSIFLQSKLRLFESSDFNPIITRHHIKTRVDFADSKDGGSSSSPGMCTVNNQRQSINHAVRRCIFTPTICGTITRR